MTVAWPWIVVAAMVGATVAGLAVAFRIFTNTLFEVIRNLRKECAAKDEEITRLENRIDELNYRWDDR
jgi:hypothetical protein